MNQPRRVYLAGPMSGLPEGNFPAFRTAAYDLRDRGIEVVSPVELNAEAGFDAVADLGHPRRGEFLHRDICHVLHSQTEAVVVLKGWERSEGARLEVAVARGIGKPVLVYPEMVQVAEATVARPEPEPVAAQPAADLHPLAARFEAIVAEIIELQRRKMADYGRADDPFANIRAASEWGMPAWVGAMVRATDKVRRLQSYALTGTLANEGARDAFLDCAAYAVIALVLHDEEA